MATSFDQLVGRLKGQVTQLDPMAAPLLVNDALRDIYDERGWSFLIKRGTLFAPAQITTGTVSVTRFSDAVTFNGAAAAVLDVTSNPAVTLRQLRIAGGLPYQLSAYSPGGTATLDRPYQEAADAAASFQFYRCYFSPPAPDFLRFVTVTDFSNSYRLVLNVQQADLDMIDPQRTTGSQPVLLADYVSDSNGNPQYEMWPHPTSEIQFNCTYQARFTELVGGSNIPAALSADLVLTRAKFRAYEWAESNKGSHASLQKTNWMNLMAASRVEYDSLLRKAKRQDKQTFMTSNLGSLPFAFNLDSGYLQAHDVLSQFIYR